LDDLPKSLFLACKPTKYNLGSCYSTGSDLSVLDAIQQFQAILPGFLEILSHSELIPDAT